MTTIHRNVTHGYKCLVDQSIFVRNTRQGDISVPGGQQVDNKWRNEGVGDIPTPDNTLNIDGIRILDDIERIDVTTTAPSSGEVVKSVETTWADMGTQELILDNVGTQYVLNKNKVAEVKEIDNITRISSVWNPVLMSDSGRGEISSIPDVPTTAPSSGAGPTVANTDNGIPQIAENFTCSAVTTLGMMNK